MIGEVEVRVTVRASGDGDDSDFQKFVANVMAAARNMSRESLVAGTKLSAPTVSVAKSREKMQR